jgi:hypothetical protein
MMQAIHFSDLSVLTRAKRRHIPEDAIHQVILYIENLIGSPGICGKATSECLTSKDAFVNVYVRVRCLCMLPSVLACEQTHIRKDYAFYLWQTEISTTFIFSFHLTVYPVLDMKLERKSHTHG